MHRKRENRKEWHVHEKKIKKQLEDFFKEKNYLISFNKCYDTFDVVCAKISQNHVVQEIIGIEIKSDKDQIIRLKDQLVRYFRLFDKVYIALENRSVPEFVPTYIGIIRCNNKVSIEREAEILYIKPTLGNAINFQAIRNTIKDSGGLKTRSKELFAYISTFEDVKRKLLYNSIFSENILPFSNKEKKVITFINKNYQDVIDLDLFSYSFGEVSINDKL
jgi:hypothetical protein